LRNRLNDTPAPRATTRWLRAGILVLLLAAYAAPAALTTGTETVHITEGNTQEAITAAHGDDIVAARRTFSDPTFGDPTFDTQGVHAWAG
jgi:hypothetical protein